MAKNKKKRRKPERSEKQVYAINQSTLDQVKKLRSCLRDVLGLEGQLCQCTDAYRDKKEVDPCCQAHEWHREVVAIINHYRLKMHDMNTSDVYFVQGQQSRLIKIGSAKDVGRRIATLQVGSAERLELRGILFGGGLAMEKSLQNRFIDCHAQGEWFRPAPRLMRYIKENTWQAQPVRQCTVIEDA